MTCEAGAQWADDWQVPCVDMCMLVLWLWSPCSGHRCVHVCAPCGGSRPPFPGSIMRAVCPCAIAASIAAFSGGVSCQRDHAGAVGIDAGRVCLAAPPACCLENAPFESRCLTPSPLASPGGHMGGHAGGSVMCHVPRHGRRRARDGAAAR